MNKADKGKKQSKKWIILIMLLIGSVFGGACGKEGSTEQGDVVGTRDNTSVVLVPTADGEAVTQGQDVLVDASNLEEGYVMVQYQGSNTKVRLLVTTPSQEVYKYYLVKNGEYEAFPLSEGNGSYHIEVYENLEEDKYALIHSQDLEVNLAEENRVFLYANQYVDYNDTSNVVTKAKELAEGARTDLDVVKSVYEYVMEHIAYDYDKAATVTASYLPNVDATLEEGKGICFDYSALMTAMLRSQRIPTRLDIGYRDTAYHAWISVYTEEEGWIDQIIVFDGENWSLMDPTLAAEAGKSTMKEYMENQNTYYQLMYKY